MRNYIELNGKSSNDIIGLLIQQLPPISKPKIRTQIDEIDGRNGDIVTKLGFSAYDKIVEIGLYGDFDINDVIQYFNGDGKVVFSNEPDKYYNYQILDQIDYERLIRFRTAKVKFHVQPFKYSAVEGVLKFTSFTNDEITVINNGNYISKPIITITGSGTINLSLNGYQIFVIDMGDNEQIVIDTNLMEAYNPTNQVLLNRSVTGNYDNFSLNVSKNTISWSGTISEIDVENYSRWI